MDNKFKLSDTEEYKELDAKLKEFIAIVDETKDNKKPKGKKTMIASLVIASLFLVITVLLYAGTSFARYVSRGEQVNENNISTACFSLDMVDNGSINLTPTSGKPMYPMSEEEAMGYVTPYTFTVTNNCSTNMYFNVTLNTTGSSDLDNLLVYKLTDESDNLINKAIIGTLPTYTEYNNTTYKEGTPDAYSIINSYILTSGFLGRATLDSSNQVVTAGGSKSYKLYIWMDESVTDLTTMNKTFEGKILVTQATKKLAKVCKRANPSTFHTEECDHSEYYCADAGYSQGDTITYGNASVTPQVLTSGDAFDCDVNLDGIYDPETERFYYVSTMDNGATQDTDTAVLIAAKDYVTTTVAWATDGTLTNGPVVASANLPTINDWPNVNLKSISRNITSDTGTVKLENYEYKKNSVDLAARLLTRQELTNACGLTSGFIDNKNACRYLFEGTAFAGSAASTGTWLETVDTYNPTVAYHIEGASFASANLAFNNTVAHTARPVIEVAKTDIEY